MTELDFTLELNSEGLSKETEYELFTEAESRLKQLARGHTDLTGAAINIRPPSGGETMYLHEVVIILYIRPNHIVAVQKETNPHLALKEALNAVERQVRDRREKLQKRWQQPGNLPREQEIIEVISAESGK